MFQNSKMTSGPRMTSYISQDLSCDKVITDPTDLSPSPGSIHQMLRLQQPALLLRVCEFSCIYLCPSRSSPPTLRLQKLCFSSHAPGWQPELVAAGRGRAAGIGQGAGERALGSGCSWGSNIRSSDFQMLIIHCSGQTFQRSASTY